MTKLDKILAIPQWWMHVQQHNIKDIQMGESVTCNSLWRHKKRGTTYEVLFEATLQMMNNQRHCDLDDARCIVYKSLEDGRYWVRLKTEFMDGRFTEIDEEENMKTVNLTIV